MFKRFDNKIKTAYCKIDDYAMGKLLLKLLEGIILAILIGYSINIISSIDSEFNKYNIEREQIESLSIGSNIEYIDDKLGTPAFRHYDESSQLSDCIYVLKGFIIRVYYYQNTAKGVFITLKDVNWVGKLSLPYIDNFTNGQKLGEFSFYDITNSPDNIYGFITNGSGLSYYSESYYFASSGNYYDFIFSSLPYGVFLENHGTSFVDNEILGFNLSPDELFFAKNRIYACPNTIGIVSQDSLIDIERLICNWNNFDYFALMN